ncbi:MAG: hypothetical protein NVS2B8_20600 [Vulcanimicrobiaceae bacterium]
MIRGFALGAAAFAAVFVAERQLARAGADVARYDRMRAMSGDPPFATEAIHYVTRAVGRYGASRSDDTKALLANVTRDLARYAELRGM